MQNLLSHFAPGRRLKVVIDTDTYNEIDDQFALVYALLSPDRMAVEAIYAAPFENSRVASYAEGMELSFQEILRVIGLLGLGGAGQVFRGATCRISEHGDSGSAASSDLIRRAQALPDGERLVVIAIGAATNVAAALATAPEISEKIVLLWLGGHPSHWPHNREFNLRGDPEAVRIILKSNVPFGLFPCATVAEALTTTVSELAPNLKGRGEIGDYLFDIFANYDHENLQAIAASKTIWDLAPFAWAIEPEWFDVRETIRPDLSEDLSWKNGDTQETLLEAIRLQRDPIFRDFFSKIQAFKEGRIVARMVDPGLKRMI
ncbi:nucleoside hydrolase [Pelagicoccus mobilis]|uniref:Nucleoside hydrolase n=1 Tax=Pelagicoccus mobilis TaxID=415221 RepID=A0A934RRD0_9BACT|nr:nucleoside hydrolase [Pelagicoccus mobilis]MBK1875492.1 nucleoside hydrolase [Pelagicoccus mobilis]